MREGKLGCVTVPINVLQSMHMRSSLDVKLKAMYSQRSNVQCTEDRWKKAHRMSKGVEGHATEREGEHVQRERTGRRIDVRESRRAGLCRSKCCASKQKVRG